MSPLSTLDPGAPEARRRYFARQAQVDAINNRVTVNAPQYDPTTDPTGENDPNLAAEYGGAKTGALTDSAEALRQAKLAQELQGGAAAVPEALRAIQFQKQGGVYGVLHSLTPIQQQTLAVRGNLLKQKAFDQNAQQTAAVLDEGLADPNKFTDLAKQLGWKDIARNQNVMPGANTVSGGEQKSYTVTLPGQWDAASKTWGADRQVQMTEGQLRSAAMAQKEGQLHAQFANKNTDIFGEKPQSLASQNSALYAINQRAPQAPPVIIKGEYHNGRMIFPNGTHIDIDPDAVRHDKGLPVTGQIITTANGQAQTTVNPDGTASLRILPGSEPPNKTQLEKSVNGATGEAVWHMYDEVTGHSVNVTPTDLPPGVPDAPKTLPPERGFVTINGKKVFGDSVTSWQKQPNGQWGWTNTFTPVTDQSFSGPADVYAANKEARDAADETRKAQAAEYNKYEFKTEPRFQVDPQTGLPTTYRDGTMLVKIERSPGKDPVITKLDLESVPNPNEYQYPNPFAKPPAQPNAPAPAAAPAAQPATAAQPPPLPPIEKREIGKVYILPNGRQFVWRGNGLEPI